MICSQQQLNQAIMLHQRIAHLEQFQMIPRHRKELASLRNQWNRLAPSLREAVELQLPIQFGDTNAALA